MSARLAALAVHMPLPLVVAPLLVCVALAGACGTGPTTGPASTVPVPTPQEGP